MRTIIFCLSILACSKASWNDLSATIAVVEFQSVMNQSIPSTERVSSNVLLYEEVLTSLKETTLDMIIFPEASLRTDHETAAKIQIDDNPCDNDNYPAYLKTLSCAARNLSVYLVTNLVEKSACDHSSTGQNCKNEGFYFYNTNVIFDRQGTIAKRYRKYNLFGEETLDPSAKPELVTIDTDFGIKFGTFTCFDILFKSPAQDVLKEGIDGVVYTTNWHSELPFLTALQTQQMWAYAHNITIFAAGGSNPNDAIGGSGGSGVFRGSEGTILSDIIANGGSKIYFYESKNGQVNSISDKDVDDLGKDMDAFTLATDNSLKNYTWVPLNNSNTDNFQLCSGRGLCCNFNVKLSFNRPISAIYYHYLLVVYSGIRHYPGIIDGGLEVCGIIACLNSSISSCGQRFPNYEDITWPITFEEITVEGSFTISENKTQFPNSLLSSIRPIDASETEWTTEEIEETMVKKKFSLKKAQNRLMTFAIYGRDFTHDSLANDGNQDDDYNGSEEAVGIVWLLLCSLILSIITTK